MTTELPDPLVLAEVDLRDFQYMELDVRMLRDSRFAAQVSGDAFRAGVLLWCASWHQLPAGSLPDDDIELANLAGYGRFVKEWKKVRDEALTLFVKCGDGRLYHQVVAEKANAAWNSRLHYFYDKARDRLRKTNKIRMAEKLDALKELTFEDWNSRRISAGIPPERADASAGIPENAPKEKHGIPVENGLKGNVDGKGEGEGEGEGDCKQALSSPPAPPPVAPTTAGAICARIRKAGIPDANPSHPTLLALIDAGVTPDEIADAAADAKARGKGFAYTLAVVEGRRRDAAKAVDKLPSGATRTTLADRNRAAADEAKSLIFGEGNQRATG